MGMWRMDIARTLRFLASVWYQTGSPKAAEKSWKESLDMMRTIHGDALHDEVAAALHELGTAFQWEGNLHTSKSPRLSMSLAQCAGTWAK